jgi:hypothetical protein
MEAVEAVVTERAKGTDCEALLSSQKPRPEELQRFVESSGGNVDKAAHLYLKTRRWRSENGVDDSLSDTHSAEIHERVSQCMSYYTGLVDKHKRPLVVWRTGATQARKLMETVGPKDVLRNHLVRRLSAICPIITPHLHLLLAHL